MRKGIALGEGLAMVAASTSDRQAAAALHRLSTAVADRKALSSAMAETGDSFSASDLADAARPSRYPPSIPARMAASVTAGIPQSAKASMDGY